MTDGAWEIVGRDHHQLPLDKTLGDALRQLVRKRFKTNAAKQIAQRWGLDPKTAQNVVQRGCVSERTITKAVRAEGWSLLLALGAELTGQTHHEWEEQLLDRIISEAERDREKVRRLRDKAALVRERADRVASTLYGPDADARQRQVP